MTELATAGLRTLGPIDAIPNDLAVARYLDDRNLRISIARVDDRLYAFDDCARAATRRARSLGGSSPGRRSCASATARGSITTGAVINGPATAPLNPYEVQDVDDVRIRG